MTPERGRRSRITIAIRSGEMFVMTMPKTFRVGDTADCRINKQPARLTWRDAKTLVIEPNDARTIITTHYDGDLVHFTCGDAGVITVDGDEGIEGYIVTTRKRDGSDAPLPGLPEGPPLKY